MPNSRRRPSTVGVAPEQVFDADRSERRQCRRVREPDHASAGMRDKPETAFETMNTDILEATMTGYVRPNFCDHIRNARFESWPGGDAIGLARTGGRARVISIAC
jgi:hypothetical protein